MSSLGVRASLVARSFLVCRAFFHIRALMSALGARRAETVLGENWWVQVLTRQRRGGAEGLSLSSGFLVRYGLRLMGVPERKAGDSAGDEERRLASEVRTRA